MSAAESASFAEKYQAYQGSVREGKAALDLRDYAKAIEHYSQALEMSPFDDQTYYAPNCGLGRWPYENNGEMS